MSASTSSRRWRVVGLLTALALTPSVLACSGGDGAASPATTTTPADGSSTIVPHPAGTGASPTEIDTVPGMPPVVDPANLYSETTAGKLQPWLAGVPLRVYVPNGRSNDVTVIDVATKQVIDTFPVDAEPQHVVPSYDLRTLWVLSNQGYSLTAIDPTTGKPVATLPVEDPYNLYFTPDGSEAIVVAEALRRLDFRDPHTMALHSSIEVPDCAGINHIDFSVDGRYLIATCEFAGRLAKIDLLERRVVGMLELSGGGMPQDIRISPDGRTFYVAEMMRNGVYLIDAASFSEAGFVETGVGAHGLYPSRDATKLYVINRGSNRVPGPPRGPGSVAVLDLATNQVVERWEVPGGGSPDMGNLTPDGRELWLGGRYDDEVYVFDTTTGALAARIPVGKGPHGLTVWPQPGRYSLGHTGNMR
ncbi:YVTN family beta-propeller repeat protein [Rhabdothermincola sp.]|uniref:YVTN family beta-propeller repeat protein n=1 Tax=Rhabdothermincola sp. TaxID=2820405 RepID=UPI002FDF749B